MKTLHSILNDLKDNTEHPTEEEYYYTTLVMDTVISILQSRVGLLISGYSTEEDISHQTIEEMFGIEKMLDMSPKEIVGNWCPNNPDYQIQRTKSKESLALIKQSIEKKMTQISHDVDNKEAAKLKEEDKLN